LKDTYDNPVRVGGDEDFFRRTSVEVSLADQSLVARAVAARVCRLIESGSSTPMTLEIPTAGIRRELPVLCVRRQTFST
jgi:hypothetical protein